MVKLTPNGQHRNYWSVRSTFDVGAGLMTTSLFSGLGLLDLQFIRLSADSRFSTRGDYHPVGRYGRMFCIHKYYSGNNFRFTKVHCPAGHNT